MVLTVAWTMSGGNDVLSKAFSLFMGGMDKMFGPDFEKGLAQMKTVAEEKKSGDECHTGTMAIGVGSDNKTSQIPDNPCFAR